MRACESEINVEALLAEAACVRGCGSTFYRRTSKHYFHKILYYQQQLATVGYDLRLVHGTMLAKRLFTIGLLTLFHLGKMRALLKQKGSSGLELPPSFYLAYHIQESPPFYTAC